MLCFCFFTYFNCVEKKRNIMNVLMDSMNNNCIALALQQYLFTFLDMNSTLLLARNKTKFE